MNWETFFTQERIQPYFQALMDFVEAQYAKKTVYPPREQLFSCFQECPFETVRAVILGQDPYIHEHQAHGLCFSVQEGIEPPPSLVNIFKELRDDIGCEIPKSGNLTKWATEGVLLLNTALTVRAHRANSHKDCGWTWFTDSVISLLSEQKEHLVFLLWGGNARSKKPLIDRSKHLILECAHPSPLSAYNGFFGCRHFSKTNDYLVLHGLTPIDWDLSKD